MLIDISTRQERQGFSDDIIVYVFDELNYNRFMRHVNAANTYQSRISLEPYEIFIHAKSYWSTLYFKPPSRGKYFVVLDNSHSGQTPKICDVVIYKEYEQSQTLSRLRSKMTEYGWSDLWELYIKATTYARLGDHASACDNLRKLLIISWTRVCERLSAAKITVPNGKSVDVKPLEQTLETNGVSTHITSFITRTWSLVSELAHIEKKDGKQPHAYDTGLAVNATLNALAYLFSLVDSGSKDKPLAF